MTYRMHLISRDELKRTLERKEPSQLVMALGDWQYRAQHIPGSLHFLTLEDALASLAQDDEMVVSCSHSACPASVFAYEYLVHHGYTHVRRYAGGILDWEEAGYPLEGEMVAAKTRKQEEGGGYDNETCDPGSGRRAHRISNHRA